MFSITKDLAKFFEEDIKANGHLPGLHYLCDEGVLVIDRKNNIFEAVHVYRGELIDGNFIVTSGWHQSGCYNPSERIIIIDKTCVIGPGYQTEKFLAENNGKYLRVYRTEGFEPRKAFKGKSVQENADYL